MVFAMASILGACSASGLSEGAPRQPSLRVADAALTSGAPELALRVADLVLAKQPDNVPALIARGDALYALNRREMARVAYRAAIAIDAASVKAQVGLGRTLARSDPRAAEAAFLSALAEEPDNVVALNNLGVVRDLQGHNSEAQEAYDHALSVAPGSVDVQINLGTSLALSGHSAEAVQLLRGVAAVPGATQAWRKELLAGLTLAGDEPWAQQMLQAEPVQAPQAPAFVGASAHFASVAAPSPIVVKASDTAPVGKPGAAPLVHSKSQGSEAQTSDATHYVPEPAVAEVQASIQIPVLDTAPRMPVLATDLSSLVSAPSVVPSVAIRPIVTASRELASVSPSRSETTTPPIDTNVGNSPPSVPKDGQSVASQSTAPSAGVRQDVSVAGSGPYVQLAAVISEPDAMFEWHRLDRRYSRFLLGREPMIIPPKGRWHTHWQLRTGGFASLAEANTLCRQLKAAGLHCFSGRSL